MNKKVLSSEDKTIIYGIIIISVIIITIIYIIPSMGNHRPSFIWDKTYYEITKDTCKEITHPELSPENEVEYNHCIDYPETYGINPYGAYQ